MATRSKGPEREEDSPRSDDDKEESMTLMVEGLTRSVEDSHLREIFGSYGVVTNAEVERDRQTRLSKVGQI